MGRLDGKVAIITGAARGQGEEEARLFVSEGAKVMLGDVLDAEGKTVASSLGDAAKYMHHDVTKESEWQAIVAATTEHFGKVDILINNAGIVHIAPIAAMDLDDYMRVIKINQVGCLLGMKTVIPAMAQNGGGSIINISSISGMEGTPGVGAYVASKWAIRGMTKTAAIECGPLNIRVNSIHPGGIDTVMGRGEQEGFANIDTAATYAGLPIPRIGQPREVAWLAVFLASDEASYCTGSEFVVDGGWTAGTRMPEM